MWCERKISQGMVSVLLLAMFLPMDITSTIFSMRDSSCSCVCFPSEWFPMALALQYFVLWRNGEAVVGANCLGDVAVICSACKLWHVCMACGGAKYEAKVMHVIQARSEGRGAVDKVLEYIFKDLEHVFELIDYLQNCTWSLGLHSCQWVPQKASPLSLRP